VIPSTILTALVLSSIVALADPGLLPEKALASTPQSSKEITPKQSGAMALTDALYRVSASNFVFNNTDSFAEVRLCASNWSMKCVE